MVLTPTAQQKAAALKALQQLRSQQVPQFEQGFVTDTILETVAGIVLTNADNPETAFTALQQYRQNEVPWYEQGAVSDDLLKLLVTTVLNAAGELKFDE